MKTRLVFFFIITLPAITKFANAATINWTGGTSTAWNSAFNWSTGTVPTSSDVVQIGVASAFLFQPTITANASCSSLTISNLQAVTLTVSAPLTISNTLTVTSGTINSTTGGTINASNITASAGTFSLGAALTVINNITTTNNTAITSNSSGTITASNISISASTLTLNGVLSVSSVLQTPTSPGGNSTITTNATGNSIASGIAVHTSSNLTWNGSGTTTCGGSTVYSTTTLTIGTGNTINFTGGLTINSGTTPGFLINNGALTVTNSSISTGGPSAQTTVVTNNSGASITLTGGSGGISLGSNAGVSNSGIITANSGTTLGTSGGSFYTNNSGGVINLTGATFTLTGNSSLSNSGSIGLSSTSTMTTGNPCTVTNSSSGTMTVSASSVTVNGGTTFNNSGSIAFSGSSTLSTGNPVTLTNSAGASLTFATTTVNFNGGTTINNSGIISGTSSTTITAGNPVPITNNSTGTISLSASTLTLQGGANINNSGAVSAVAGSTISFANPSYINNSTSASTLVVTASTLSVSAGGYITNSGTVTTSASSTVALNGNPTSITNNVNSTFNATATTFTLVAGSTITNTGGTFNATSSPFTVGGNPSSITNQNSGGTTGVFTFNACPLTFNGSNSLVNSGTLTINNGSSVNMTASGTLSNINNSGTFYAGTSNSSVTITTVGSQSKISNSNIFYLGSTSSITLGGNLSSVSNSGTFTIQSDQYGSGVIGTIGASASGYSGTYNVERYISGGSPSYRGYRLFSSPVYAATVSSNKVYSINYIQTGALITGNAGGGFDQTGNPSLYLNREDKAVSNATYVSGNFWGISAINNSPNYNYYLNGIATTYNIPVANGFLFWFRGNRTTNLANKYTPGTSAESVTMTAIGSLTQGQVIVHNWYTPASANLGYTVTAGNTTIRGYDMVGNPYASPIDWETFQTSTTTTGIYGANVGAVIYLLNPLNQNYGVYAKGGGGIGTNSATNIIESGQGFFVVAATASGQLIFNETAKTTAQATGSNLLMGKPVGNDVVQYLRLQLVKDTINTDDLLIRFKSGVSTAYSPLNDAAYKQGFGKVSISSLSSDHIPLAINVRPLPTTSSAVGLNVNTSTDGTYHLNMKTIVGVPQLFDIWLMDKYKKDSLNMRDNATYTFDVIKSDTNSFGANRFSLVIRQNPAYAYRLLSFSGSKTAVSAAGSNTKTTLATPSAGNTSASISLRQVQLVWIVENEQNYTNFTVERSTNNGKTYDVVGSMTGNAQGTYSLVDNSPADQNLYRLKQEDINDSINYSKVVSIGYAPLSNTLANNSINVYPNPATSNINLTITNNNNTSTSYHITIATSTGLVIKQATSSQSDWQANVSDMKPGTYLIKVFNSKDDAFIGNAKFVKL